MRASLATWRKLDLIVQNSFPKYFNQLRNPCNLDLECGLFTFCILSWVLPSKVWTSSFFACSRLKTKYIQFKAISMSLCDQNPCGHEDLGYPKFSEVVKSLEPLACCPFHRFEQGIN